MNGDEVRRIRLERGHTQETLAALIRSRARFYKDPALAQAARGMTSGVISRAERGWNVDPKTVRLIEDALKARNLTAATVAA
jgi:transcriptional regulator with XRE-family HTH domain